MTKLDTKKKRIFTPEHRHNLSLALRGNKICLGRILSKQTKKKISLARKKYYLQHSVWNKGVPHSDKAKRKMSLSTKKTILEQGHPRGMLNKHHTEKTKKKMSLERKERWENPIYREKMRKHQQDPRFRKKLSLAAKKRWQNKDYREKVIRNTLLAIHKRPTSFEQKIINLIKEYDLPYKYVGNGKIFIDGKNPDFINTNNEKILIEVYGKYWKFKNYEEQRSKRFAKYGYKTVFLSDDDLLTKNWKQICLEKINND